MCPRWAFCSGCFRGITSGDRLRGIGRNKIDIFIANINVVYDKCNIAEPFGQSNVQRWLDCSKSKATNVMNAIKKAEIICKVKGPVLENISL